MHEKSSFITLTYSDEHLKSPRLIYSDWQNFMKLLRKTQTTPIGVLVTGEYGEKTKRPHWHAILFGYRPPDLVHYRTNERGDRIYTSRSLEKLWKMGRCEIGEVTIQSAGYTARYAAKKLVHGRDQDHDFHPISRMSSKHAIGKKWIEKYWQDVFTEGKVVLADGSSLPVPRYYERWFKENHPALWLAYVTGAKQKKINRAAAREEKYKQAFYQNAWGRPFYKAWPLTRNQIRKVIQDQKFKLLQNYLKL